MDNKPGGKKWRLLFWVNTLAAISLFTILHVYPVKYFIIAKREVLMQWYPHLGPAVFYLLKGAVLLQMILCAIALGWVLCFLITPLAGVVKRLIKKAGERTMQFKVISSVLALVPLLILIKLGINFFNMPGKSGYDLNEAINKRNEECANGNLFGFTDRNHTPEKPKGIFRIGVLGDSFVWGDGLSYEQAWSHKLERKLLAKYDSVEILHWGKCGWSTLDEFNFFKQYGRDYGINLLIIAWVDNDADMRKWPTIQALSAGDAYPVISKIYPTLAQRLANSDESIATNNWYTHLYSDENLRDYQKLLTGFRVYLSTQKVEPLVVMTPSPGIKHANWKFTKAEPLIRKAGFQCLNLYAPAQKKLGRYSELQLQANPVNGHPGALMTEEYANEVMDYLQTNRYLDKLPERQVNNR